VSIIPRFLGTKGVAEELEEVDLVVLLYIGGSVPNLGLGTRMELEPTSFLHEPKTVDRLPSFVRGIGLLRASSFADLGVKECRPA